MRNLTLALLASLSCVAFAQDMDDGMGMGMGGDMAEKGDRVSFEKQVLPLLRESCFECHSDKKKKPKGALRLDGRSWILVGGKGGPAVLAGKPDRSPLYLRATLPDDHDDVMPPSGEVLEKDQLALLKRWIEEGAEFGSWKGKAPELTAAVDGPRRKREGPKGVDRFAVYKRLEENIGAPSATAMKKATDAGFRVEPVMPRGKLLRVEVVSAREDASDKAVASLAGLRRHVAVLTLGATGITDRALIEIAKLPNLVRLDLQKTGITDAALKTLGKAKLPELRRLNLYGTAVTDAGLAALTLPRLEKIYLWESKATEQGAAQLRERHPGLKVYLTRDLPKAERGGTADGNRRGGKNKKKKKK
ncbi:MAG: c-type cytochrome domain-containing protein [Planctomycetota bacterium]|jgi:hypothetical protein